MCTIIQRPAMPDVPVLKALAEPPHFPDVFTFGAGPLPLALPPHHTLSTPTAPDTHTTTPRFTFSVLSSSSSGAATASGAGKGGDGSPSLAAAAAAAAAAPNPRKRRRRLTDVDGDRTSALLRKKRRLRLTLVTSRLSRPFSAPATNIVDRGRSKAAGWARARLARHAVVTTAGPVRANGAEGGLAGTSCRSFGAATLEGWEQPTLHKAAILNSMRLRGCLRGGAADKSTLVVSAVELRPLERQLRGQDPQTPTAAAAERVVDEPFVELADAPVNAVVEETSIQSPNMVAAGSKLQPYAPSAPSPLGMTYYDALDLEDDCAEHSGEDYDDDDDDNDEEHDVPARNVGEKRTPGGKFGDEAYDTSFYSDFGAFAEEAGGNDDDDDADDDVGFLGFSAIPW